MTQGAAYFVMAFLLQMVMIVSELWFSRNYRALTFPPTDYEIRPA